MGTKIETMLFFYSYMLILKIFFVSLMIFCGTFVYPDSEIDSLLSNSSAAFDEKRIENGLILLDKASQLAEEKKDPDACLKIGLIYGSLPEELERRESAIDILLKGSGFAIAQGKWHLLNDFAMSLQNLGERDAAIGVYDELFLKAGELRDKDVISVLKTRYEELGDEERGDICIRMIEALTIPPPPDWDPAGETVRGPKESPPDAVQATQRQIEDQSVQKTMEYFIEKKKLEEQKKKRIN